MKELINKVYETKMKDGSFERIVSEQFEKMIKDVCGDVFGYGSDIKKKMQSNIGELMSGVVESSDFSEYVVKIQTVIDETLNNSSLGDYKEMLKKIKSLFGIKEVQFGQQVKITEILEKYTEYMESELSEDDFDDDEINRDDGTKNAYLECYVEVENAEDDKRGYFSSIREKKLVKLGHEKEDEHEDTIIEFEIVKDYKDRYGVRLDKDFRVSDLRYLPSFIVYLLNLQQACAEIIIDTTNSTDEADFEFEWD